MAAAGTQFLIVTALELLFDDLLSCGVFLSCVGLRTDFRLRRRLLRRYGSRSVWP